MIDWRDAHSGATFRKAEFLDCSLCAYPARKRGAYAIHLHATFGMQADVSFSIIHYTRYLDGTLVLPVAGISAEFDRMSVWDAAKFSIDGKLVAGGMHLIAYTPVPKIEPELAQVDVRMGIKICHPTEDETRIKARVPLHVHQPTGPLAPPKRPLGLEGGSLPDIASVSGGRT